ncbi:hypothetical protein C8J56DRAFT_903297 [Mycena floridula]|nr:hypothetical protein C8J56DRAFT_903297 [Mycena floridula]
MPNNLEALQVLKSEIESPTRETLAVSTLNPKFIIDIHDARDDLSTTSSLAYPFALTCLCWSIRAAKKDGRALLNKIRVCQNWNDEPLTGLHRTRTAKDQTSYVLPIQTTMSMRGLRPRKWVRRRAVWNRRARLSLLKVLLALHCRGGLTCSKIPSRARASVIVAQVTVWVLSAENLGGIDDTAVRADAAVENIAVPAASVRMLEQEIHPSTCTCIQKGPIDAYSAKEMRNEGLLDLMQVVKEGLRL